MQRPLKLSSMSSYSTDPSSNSLNFNQNSNQSSLSPPVILTDIETLQQEILFLRKQLARYTEGRSLPLTPLQPSEVINKRNTHLRIEYHSSFSSPIEVSTYGNANHFLFFFTF